MYISIVPLSLFWLLRQASDCRIVLLVGLVVMAAPLTLLCLFNDDHSLQERDEAVQCAPSVMGRRSSSRTTIARPQPLT